jgi:hypothetical protein
MVRRPLFAVGVVVLAAVAGGLASCAAQTKRATPAPAAPPEADLAGKVVFVQTQREAATLEKARVRRLGDRDFIVGRVAKDDTLTKPQFVGSTLWLPLSDVTRMAVYDDLEQLRKNVQPRRAE